jgi:hypothetical protein
MDSCSSREEPLVGFCEHHNEMSGSIKYTDSLLDKKTLSFSKANFLHRH